MSQNLWSGGSIALMHGRDISLSIQTFEDLITDQFIYVDKTLFLYALLQVPKMACFFSRPRRFGKSLTISTLDAIFRGQRHLFETLAISKTDYDWPVHPVIRLDMKYAAESTADLAQKGLEAMLEKVALQYSVSVQGETVAVYFERLIQALYVKTGQKVVVLIDEYDKPLIDNLDNLEEAKKIQGLLKRFYGVLKSADEFIRFVFITGVSKFSKVSIFSDLNHLTDISMNPTYAALVGMTEDELIRCYMPYIQAIADRKQWTVEGVLDEIRRWYNGYRFSEAEIKVYNPWSTLSLFYSGKFQEHWYTTGIPKLLVDIINRDKERFSQLNPADFDAMPDCSMAQMDTYDIETLQLTPLMLQTGFITIQAYNETRNTFTLGYPNWEVRQAFSSMVLESRLSIPYSQSPRIVAMDIKEALEEKRMEDLISHLNRLIASIPGNLHTPKESYYHSLIHMIFQTSGLTLRSEEWVAGGRIDTVIEEPDSFYIIEFKFGSSAEAAIAQIKNRTYSKKFERGGKPIRALGIGVDCDTKSIKDWALVLLD